jgi:hypothetical protein
MFVVSMSFLISVKPARNWSLAEYHLPSKKS